MRRLLAEYQAILGLNDWDIVFEETEMIDVNARTKIIFNDYKAVVQINSTLSEVEKERALIHELMHLIFRDAYDIFTENCSDEFAKQYCERQHERAIEKTAKIIYKLAR